ncbi:CDP-alcohol phosphatidyltransferase family protein [Sneathiella marina]|uniref:CDP-alcohol phosphatidyltransferase family protein n=1 Tax=Sneathiella marina TaxID=2950108 RepID=A0ABY4W4G2_9PROT|nr:CDP-alcohol phosphatidyltransferase family protein [Sneathiella marina]USG62091.1 CDP-alcohol phosphatidyltransferase family protein [Sneathiella marina]
MFDAALRQVIDPPLNYIGTKVAALGVSANMVTFVGFGLGVAAVPFIVAESYGIALLLILTNRVFDGLDGAVARHSLLTDFGGYLDIVCDFIFYSAVVFAFAWARPENTLAGAFLILSFMGTASTFLTYAIMAEKHKITTDIRGRKSLYYLGGLTEGMETIVAMVLMCLLPDYFVEIAVVFGVMCWVTTVTRIYAAWLAFRNLP